MKKTTKGALAAGAAAALLLGGAGSLAYWTSSQTVTGGTFQTGQLSLTQISCDSTWSWASGTDQGTALSATSTLVPGDSVEKTCKYTVNATGDHLQATLSTPTTVTMTPAATAPAVTFNVGATYTLGGSTPTTTVTSADNGKELDAVITVSFPFGDGTTTNFDTTSQNLTETLDNLSVTLTQDQTGANPVT